MKNVSTAMISAKKAMSIQRTWTPRSALACMSVLRREKMRRRARGRTRIVGQNEPDRGVAGCSAGRGRDQQPVAVNRVRPGGHVGRALLSAISDDLCAGAADP